MAEWPPIIVSTFAEARLPVHSLGKKCHIKANKLKLVQAWVEIHNEELMADWELASKGEQVFKIEPLR